MRNEVKKSNGELSKYGLACGYVQERRVTIRNSEYLVVVRMYREHSVYDVMSSLYHINEDGTESYIRNTDRVCEETYELAYATYRQQIQTAKILLKESVITGEYNG